MGQAMGNIAMKFDSFAALLSMDGHGGYVWAAYGITLLVIVINLWWPRRIRTGFVRQEKRVLSRETAVKERST